MGMEDLPTFQKGAAKIPAADLQKLVDVALRQVTGGNGINVRRFGNRLVIETAGTTTPGKAVDTRLFTVVEELDDYLSCVPYVPGTGPNLDAAPVSVAKPALLQRRNWDGRTIAYDDDSTVEYDQVETGQRNFSVTTPEVTTPVTGVQAIEPPYFGIQEDGTGDIITAVTQTTDLADADDAPVAWIDTNTGARAWQIPSASGNAIWQLGLIDASSPAGVAAGQIYLLNYYNTRDISKVNNKTASGQVTAFSPSASYLFWNGELVAWTLLANGSYLIQKIWNSGIVITPSLLCVRPCVALWTGSSMYGPNTGGPSLPTIPPQLLDFCISYQNAIQLSKSVSAAAPVYIASSQAGYVWVGMVSLQTAAIHISNSTTLQSVLSFGPNFDYLTPVIPDTVSTSNGATTHTASNPTNAFGISAGGGDFPAGTANAFLENEQDPPTPLNAVPSGNGVALTGALAYFIGASLTFHAPSTESILAPPTSGSFDFGGGVVITTTASWKASPNYQAFVPT